MFCQCGGGEACRNLLTYGFYQSDDEDDIDEMSYENP